MDIQITTDHAVFQVRGGLALLVFQGSLADCLAFEAASRAKDPGRSWWTETL